jgi:GSCFA family
VLTLGLCEAWFDTKSEAYLDVAPPRPVAPADRGRFELRFVDYETNLRALEEIHGIIHRCKGDDQFELILTVSPIPLHATFMNSDVIVANAEAKAVLRAVAGEAARRFSAVTYFPAYEIAVNSEPAATWMPDGLHVQRSMANHIVATFLGTLEGADTARAVS